MNITRGRFPEDSDVPSEVFFWVGGGLKEQEAGQSVMRLGRSIKRGCVTARDECVIFPVVSDSNGGWGLRGS